MVFNIFRKINSLKEETQYLQRKIEIFEETLKTYKEELENLKKNNIRLKIRLEKIDDCMTLYNE